MSQENVQLVMSLMPVLEVDGAPYVRDDRTWTEISTAAADVIDPDFECVQHLFGTAKTFSGRDGLRSMLEDWLAPWTRYRVQIDEAIDCGEQVVLLGHAFGTREGSAQEASGEVADVWTVRDGKIVRLEAYSSHAEALQAAGMVR